MSRRADPPEEDAVPVTRAFAPQSRHVQIIGTSPSTSAPTAPPPSPSEPPGVAEVEFDELGPQPVAAPPSVLAAVSGLAHAPGVARHARGRRRRRTPWPIFVVALGALAVSFVVQMARPLPSLAVQAEVPASITTGGTLAALPWPSTGEAAVTVPGSGAVFSSGGDAPVPIASLTKIMTAYLVLRDHPITGTSTPGPSVVMTQTDVQDAAADPSINATSIPVTAGQSFSERQLLDGMVVHSANNFADSLARFDAGSVAAFVDKMNAAAASLGMTATHFTDASGIDPGGRSSAADLLQLAGAAMADPVFAAIADQPSVSFAGVGQLANYLTGVGSNGIVGIKSGFTQAAMGCVVVGAERTVQGRQVLLLASVTGQPGFNPIQSAENEAVAIINAAARQLSVTTAVSPGTRTGSVTAAWSAQSSAVVTTRAVTVVTWPGETVRYRVRLDRLGTRLAAGAPVGTLELTVGTSQMSVPLAAATSLSGPSWHWRFTRT